MAASDANRAADQSGAEPDESSAIATLKRRLAQSEPPSWWHVVAFYLVLAFVMLLVSGDPTTVGADYFKTVAQILPVFLIAFLVHSIGMLERAPDMVTRLNNELDRVGASLADEDRRDDFASARAEFDDHVQRFPDRALDAPGEVLRVVCVVALGEAIALYALAAADFSVALAVYVALVLIGLLVAFVWGVTAHIFALASSAHVDVAQRLRRTDEPEPPDR